MTLEILNIDPWLSPYTEILRRRYETAKHWLRRLDEEEGLDVFTRSYLRMGLNVQPNGDILYREWAPNAISASLIGDFSKRCIAL